MDIAYKAAPLRTYKAYTSRPRKKEHQATLFNIATQHMLSIYEKTRDLDKSLEKRLELLEPKQTNRDWTLFNQKTSKWAPICKLKNGTERKIAREEQETSPVPIDTVRKKPSPSQKPPTIDPQNPQ